MKFLIGLVLGFAIPTPAPPKIEGALLVVAMTLGFSLISYL